MNINILSTHIPYIHTHIYSHIHRSYVHISTYRYFLVLICVYTCIVCVSVEDPSYRKYLHPASTLMDPHWHTHTHTNIAHTFTVRSQTFALTAACRAAPLRSISSNFLCVYFAFTICCPFPLLPAGASIAAASATFQCIRWQLCRSFSYRCCCCIFILFLRHPDSVAIFLWRLNACRTDGRACDSKCVRCCVLFHYYFLQFSFAALSAS